MFIDRTWRLSGGDISFLSLFLSINVRCRDIESIRRAYKQMGIKAADNGYLETAIQFFDLWHYTAMKHQNEDRYELDVDILNAMERLAAARRSPIKLTEKRHTNKIRVGYLLRGIVEFNSILIKISHVLIELHDQEKFEIVAIVPETMAQVAASPQGAEHLQRLRNSGCEVLCNQFENLPIGKLEQSLLGLNEQIEAAQLDILVTSACLADFATCFTTVLRPAPKIVGLIQGPPGQFAHPGLDWSIAWSKHPLMDTPCNATLIELKMTGKAGAEEAPFSREDLQIPAHSKVLISSGRFAKFQDRAHWQAVWELLQSFSNLYYLIVGAEKEQIAGFDQMVPEALQGRVKFLGWRTDFSRIVSAADVLLDTYPSGGGQVLVEAMAQGVPVVAHRNNYLKEFCQTDWSPVEDFNVDSSLLVERGDFESLKAIIGSLLSDPQAHAHAAALCRNSMQIADPSVGVRQCERVFEMVVQR